MKVQFPFIHEAIVLGKYEKEFAQYKLVTMVPDAHKQYSRLMEKNGSSSMGKINDDPRITPLGKILRKYFINELPQLWNILKGDMKLVGIRPSTKDGWDSLFDYKQYDFKKHALQMKPGLIPPQYGYDLEKNGEDKKRFLAVSRLYLMNYKKNPLKTDIYFGCKSLYGVIFKGRFGK